MFLTGHIGGVAIKPAPGIVIIAAA